MRFVLALALVVIGIQAFSLESRKLSENLPSGPYSLEGIVSEKNSEPFACSFGSFRVHIKGQNGNETLTTLEGKGILVNSNYLTPNVTSNADIIYRFSDGAKVTEGMKLSAYCNDLGKPMDTTVTYFVRERTK